MHFDLEQIPKPKLGPVIKGSIVMSSRSAGLTIFNDGKEWMTYNADSQISYDQMYSSYDIAYGNVLISGLGFGLLAYWLADKPKVKSVTVIELSKDVIDIFKINNPVISNKIKIVNDDIRSYATNIEYDCLLLDHYETDSFDLRLKDMAEICERIKHRVFWAWSLEVAYLYYQYPTIKRHEYDTNGLTEEFLKLNNNRLNDKWESFVQTWLPKETNLFGITKRQLNKYLESYFYMHRKGQTLEV
jgi:hypothetical protein